MAAAISSMENGNRLNLSRAPPSRPSSLMVTTAASGNSRRSSRVQSRSPSSSSLTSSRTSDAGDLGTNGRRTSTSRVTTTTPPSPTRGGASGGTGVVSPGVGGGVWASLLSIGAAALPSSLLPFSTNTSSSSAPPSPRARRRSRGRSSAIIAVARARAGSGGGTVPRRLSRQQRPLAAAAAAAAASSSSRNFSLLSLPSSAATAPAPSARLARSTAAAAPGPAAEAARSGDVEPVRSQEESPRNGVAGLVAENGSREERGRSTGVRVATAAVAAGTAAPAVVVAAKASRNCGKTNRGKKVYLEGGGKVYTCACCRAHLATRDHVVSECFHGHGGRAFLFERCVNVSAGKPEDRMLMTGMHVVADIKCTSCGAELGWKYDSAADAGQKYKEGKFILERCAVTLEGCDGDGYSDGFSGRHSSRTDNRYGYGYGPEYGSDWCGSRSGGGGFVAWGADHAPIANGGHW